MRTKRTQPANEQPPAHAGVNIAFQHDAMLVSFCDLVGRSFSFHDGIVNVTMRDEANIVTERIGRTQVGRFACINLPFPLFVRLAVQLRDLIAGAGAAEAPRHRSLELEHITASYAGYDLAGRPRPAVYVTDANNQHTLTLLRMAYVHKLFEILACLLHAEQAIRLAGAARPSFFVVPVTRASIWSLQLSAERTVIICLERGGLLLGDTVNDRVAIVPPALAMRLLAFHASLPQPLDDAWLYLCPQPQGAGAVNAPQFAVARRPMQTQAPHLYVFSVGYWQFFVAALQLYLALYNFFYTQLPD